MSILASIPLLKTKTPKQVISDSWEERESVLRPNTNLFCWKRPVDETITTYLGELLDQDLEPIQFHTKTSDLDLKIKEAKSVWERESIQVVDHFWKDVSRLITDFLAFSEDGSCNVHLKVISNDACTKFHMDGYTLRLFTTYYGKGTEWLPEHATNRKGLGKSNEVIVKDPVQVQRMDPFEVGILKGQVPGSFSSVKGIVHRSPAISHTGEKRIILRVDI